jgi:hypothetical protein
MEGLQKIVKMKGGFPALNDAAKTKLSRYMVPSFDASAKRELTKSRSAISGCIRTFQTPLRLTPHS